MKMAAKTRQNSRTKGRSRANTLTVTSRRRSLILGTAILGAVILSITIVPFFMEGSPLEMHVKERLQAPSKLHPMGTDNFGRDLFCRVLWGGRTSLLVGLAVMILSGTGGILIGLIAGYYRHIDGYVMRTMDVLMSLPSLLLAMSVVSLLEASAKSVILALGIIYVPRCVRVVRGTVVIEREKEYVQSAIAVGCSEFRILFRHILPNCLSPLIVQLAFVFAEAIITESTLSFIGAGTPPPHPSWGSILSEGRQYMSVAPWIVVFPAATLMATVLGANLTGDGLRDTLDPRSCQG